MPALAGWAGLQVPISVVVRSSRQMPLRLRALIDLLVEEFLRRGFGMPAAASARQRHAHLSRGASA